MRLVLAVLLVLSNVAAADPVTLKLGSLAPRESPWGQVLRTWAKAVKEKTGGEVLIDIYWNATQGDEPVQIGKVRTGELAGAVVSATGLAVIDPDVNVFQVPGLVSSWDELDAARDALKPRFDASFKEKGFVLVGWGDIGLDRWMTKGVKLVGPKDLKGTRPWAWADDPVFTALYQVVEVTGVQKSLPEVLPELATGNINVLSISALGAEQLQWSSRLDHVSEAVVAPNIGGLVLSQKKLDEVPEKHRAFLVESGRLTAQALTKRIRDEDAKAWERVRQKMSVTALADWKAAEWSAVYAEALARAVKQGLSRTLVDEVAARVDAVRRARK